MSPNSMKKKLNITILADNPGSWVIPYAKSLISTLMKEGHTAVLIHDARKVRKGDLAFFLSCEKIIPQEIRQRNTHNLVVHESALPKGKGWSPLTWQILEGKNRVPITLFEAEDSVDSGDIYLKGEMIFRGDELIDEMRAIQGQKTIEMIMGFVRRYPGIKGTKQKGKESFYPRRRPADSALDTNKPLKDLFNQLRVADNERYPVFFIHKGKRYVLKVSKRAT